MLFFSLPFLLLVKLMGNGKILENKTSQNIKWKDFSTDMSQWKAFKINMKYHIELSGENNFSFLNFQSGNIAKISVLEVQI